MTKLAWVLVMVSSCVFGLVGVLIGGLLITNATPVAAAPAAPIKIALVNLERASRRTKLFSQRKVDYEKHQAALNAERRKRKYELNDLKSQLEDAKRKDDGSDRVLEVHVKAKEQEIEFADEFYKHNMAEIRDMYLAEVLQLVLDKAVKYADAKGFNLTLQDYALSASAADVMFSDKSWAETVMNKPVVHVPALDPYVTDITDLLGN
ncbi:MAG: hypothetical protein IT462_06635 [Planctomycetes bacterium]|nr:hypothetical protein [Planctomycetota bacterium]